MEHISVLQKELLDSINIKENGIYIDATLGYAGDSLEILKRIKRGFLFAFDQDEDAIKASDAKLKEIGKNYKIFNTNFVNMVEELTKIGVNKVDGIIFDLGLSSPQIDTDKRGFSFMHDAELDMRMDLNQTFSAKNVVNDYNLEDLIDIFYKFGEEKFSKVIAKAIVDVRKKNKINTTAELVEIIEEAVPKKYFNTEHPERRIFQAIRIEVNNELEVLVSVLPDAIKLLNPGARLSIITFHSLEDRIVKRFFRKMSEVDPIVKGMKDIPEEYMPIIKVITKKPIIPSDKEKQNNPRSKSAKLRVIERI